jgi:hypothetical protein
VEERGDAKMILQEVLGQKDGEDFWICLIFSLLKEERILTYFKLEAKYQQSRIKMQGRELLTDFKQSSSSVRL